MLGRESGDGREEEHTDASHWQVQGVGVGGYGALSDDSDKDDDGIKLFAWIHQYPSTIILIIIEKKII